MNTQGRGLPHALEDSRPSGRFRYASSSPYLSERALRLDSSAQSLPALFVLGARLRPPHNKLLTTFLNAAGARRRDGSPYTNFGSYGQPGEMTMLRA
jgi:hypothetical protein